MMAAGYVDGYGSVGCWYPEVVEYFLGDVDICMEWPTRPAFFKIVVAPLDFEYFWQQQVIVLA